MLGLQWIDIDLEAGRVSISWALHRTKRPTRSYSKRPPSSAAPNRRSEFPGQGPGSRRPRGAAGDDAWYTFRSPTTPGSRRSIEIIPPMTIEALLRHRRRQRNERTLAGVDWPDSKLVFTARIGTPVDTSNVLHRFQQISQEGWAGENALLRSWPHARVTADRGGCSSNRRSPNGLGTRPSSSRRTCTGTSSRVRTRSPQTECSGSSVPSSRSGSRKPKTIAFASRGKVR